MRGMAMVESDDYTEGRLVTIGRELDVLGANGRQLRRRQIVELAYRHGYQDGLRAAREENVEVMRALMEGKANANSR